MTDKDNAPQGGVTFDRPGWMAEVCHAAATLMEADGRERRAGQLRNVAKQLAALQSQAPQGGVTDEAIAWAMVDHSLGNCFGFVFKDRHEAERRFASLVGTGDYDIPEMISLYARPAAAQAPDVGRLVAALREIAAETSASNGTEAADRMQSIARAALSHQPAAQGEWARVPMELIDRFPEINPSNYGPDEVDALNSWGIEVVQAAAPSPGSSEGDSHE